MKHILQFIIAIVAFPFLLNAQTPVDIGDARGVVPCSTSSGSACFTEADCSTVTVQGVVTNGGELGPIRYIQDGTGGIGVYNPSAAADLNPGDLVTVTGQVSEFNCLLEITDESSFSYTVNSSGAVPGPANLAASAGYTETYEGQLVRIEAVQFTAAGTVFNGNNNYNITDAEGNTYQVRINSNSTSIVGALIPSGYLNIVGIMSQYQGSYQLLPRTFDDFEFLGTAPVFTTSINQTNLATTSFTLQFETLNEGNTTVHYGLTPDLELGTVTDADFTTNHSIDITGLEPGNIYYIQVESASSGGDISFSAVVPMATVSLSSGNISVYFNRPVDTSVSTGVDAVYLNQLIPDTLIAYINRAKYTIDMCAYTFDNENAIINALVDADERGVQVRIVADSDINPASLALMPGTKVLRPASLPGIMHNKFVVIDAFSDNPNEPVVWTGSTNFTDQQITVDPNSVIIFQDQSLAKGYTLEFEEMFGGVFSSNKTDNTPKKYLIGGIPVESYFSPTDPMNSIIINTIKSADFDLYFSLLTFTRTDIAYAIEDEIYDGEFAAGIIDQISSAEAQEVYLILEETMGEQLQVDENSAIHHHKYLLVDPNLPSSDPTVLVGSHNWSNSAAFRNDENTVVVHDASIANQYYQEFVKRYIEYGGTVLVDSVVFVPNVQLPDAALKLFPNPANGALYVQYAVNVQQAALPVQILNSLGQVVYSTTLNGNAQNSQTVSVSHLTTGIYFLRAGNAVQKFQIVR
ncbi:T9SS C-terminal target domain-containing protein [Sphingobacteriales bacterium UPWRP_1]|nr:hypothetical protein BVG80_16250 [Sphingobacteriales bacterium TSM_CSM]PSJ74873.1 T9SS C-terminal target domain-containing protein [Sphingobacteriales bacterium UPWRP_1]